MRPAHAVALAGVLALATTTGCRAEVHVGGPPHLSSHALEEKVSDVLEAEVGRRPDAMSCPHGLAGTVGATTRCVLSAGPDRLGVTVRTDRVRGEDIHFQVQVDEEPRS